MNETILSMSQANRSMNMTDFYTIETPPSSSTSKDSTDEFLSAIQSNKKFKLSTDKEEQKSTKTIRCSTSIPTNSGLTENHQVSFLRERNVLITLTQHFSPLKIASICKRNLHLMIYKTSVDKQRVSLRNSLRVYVIKGG